MENLWHTSLQSGVMHSFFRIRFAIQTLKIHPENAVRSTVLKLNLTRRVGCLQSNFLDEAMRIYAVSLHLN